MSFKKQRHHVPAVLKALLYGSHPPLSLPKVQSVSKLQFTDPSIQPETTGHRLRRGHQDMREGPDHASP